MSLKRRPTGNRESVALSSVAPMVVLVVSTVGAAGTTWIVSVTPPTSIVNGTSTACPSRTGHRFDRPDLNPCNSACRVYEPGVRNGIVKRPSRSVTAVLFALAIRLR